MLSTGLWHEKVDKTRAGNLRWRLRLLSRCRTDRGLQAAVREACRRDIVFYVNTFVWQMNPRKKGREVGPFITWDFQNQALYTILEHIETDRDLLIEKSREMGASWLCLIVMDWMALFRRNQKFLCISHTEMAVDRSDDPDSLFWKLDFMHEHLPDWLVGARPRHLKLRMKYPATGSNITGAATSERSGVGGRATAIFLDEFSKQTDDFAILGQTADVGCRIFNGTHYGIGSAFYQLTQRVDLRKLIMHWSQHPDKRRGLYQTDQKGMVRVLDGDYFHGQDYAFVLDGSPTGGPYPGLRSPWYDAECRRRASSRDVAMHLDINPSGSVAQFFDPLVIRNLEANYGRDATWEGDIDYDRDTGRFLGLVQRQGGPLRLWCHLDHRGGVKHGLYGAGGDISTGTGATPSCLSFGDALTGQKVAEYTYAHITAEALAPVAVALCWLFKTPEGEGARIAWELQGPGVVFGKKVVELGYRNIYYRQDELTGLKGQTISDVPGWSATPNNKRTLLEEYRTALTHNTFLNPSREALEECLHFQYTAAGFVEHGGEISTNDPTGARINHGDHVIADALCWNRMRSFGISKEIKKTLQVQTLSLEWRRQWHRDRQEVEV